MPQIRGDQIADGSITSADIADGSITSDDLSIPYKPAVATIDALPTLGNTINDIRLVVDASAFYTWDGDSWNLINVGDEYQIESICSSIAKPSNSQVVGSYQCAGLPKLPDKTSDTLFKNVENWATGVNGWVAYGGGTVAVVSGKLVNTHSGANQSLALSVSLAVGTRVRMRVRKVGASGANICIAGASTVYRRGAWTVADGEWVIIDTDVTVAGTSITIYTSSYNVAETYTIEVDWAYIGTGEYLTPISDMSGNGNHLISYGCIPDNLGIAFNGIHSYAARSLSEQKEIVCLSIRAKINEIDFDGIISTLKYNSGSNGCGVALRIQSYSTAGIYIGRTGSNYQSQTLSYTWDTTHEHLYTVIVDATTRIAYFYVDSILIGQTSAYDSTINLNTDILAIGRLFADSDSGYYANMSDVRDVAFLERKPEMREILGMMTGLIPNNSDQMVSGIWIPSVCGSETAGTYEITANLCRWRKIGKSVFLDVYIVFSSTITGGGTGYICIKGAPYSKLAYSLPIGSVTVENVTFTSGASLTLRHNGVESTSILSIVQSVSAGASSYLPISGISAGSTVIGSISYEIA